MRHHASHNFRNETVVSTGDAVSQVSNAWRFKYTDEVKGGYATFEAFEQALT
jgi:hypothetical protein